MHGSEPVTRDHLRRALVVNALGKPVNLLVGAGVAVAGVALGAIWLVLVAVACYAALAAITFFDEEEAGRVGERLHVRRRRALEPRAVEVDPATLAEPIRERVEAALEASGLIEDTVAEAEVDLHEVPAEVDEVVEAMIAIAARADRVHAYLGTRDPDRLRRRVATLRGVSAPDDTQLRTLGALQDQLRAIDRLRGNLDRFLSEMDHLVASLEVMHAQVVTMSTSHDAVAREDVAERVRDLREEVAVMSDGVEEALAETVVGAGRGGVEDDPKGR